MSPPGGMPPPVSATLADGVVIDLLALAVEISDEHLPRHPDELARYGDPGREWCIHDNQHILNRAALDVAGGLEFAGQIAWLAHILDSRGYPLASLADDLATAAAIVARRVPGAHADELAEVLRSGIGFIRFT